MLGSACSGARCLTCAGYWDSRDHGVSMVNGKAPLNTLKPLEGPRVNGFKVGEEMTRDGQELVLCYLLWKGKV